MDYFVELGAIGLFLSALLAATILPLSSEIVLTALLLSGSPVLPMVIIATVGNVLGSCVNYSLGSWASQHLITKWLPVSVQELETAK
jgi:membrane protein YqaA with SNARE-associated domain